ncbi:hypothetical protein, partial [Bacteriovorax sp. DB6_IX]|uniref:hypothetical protein n=1 Tax=Bacteriovorax sp. DB6_IX TaxID=1353530 RepID=UPI00038A36A1
MNKVIKLFLLSIFAISVLSYDYPKLDLSSPRSTMNYFLKSMKGHKLGDSRGLELATQTLDLSQLNEKSRNVKARDYALKLINVLDRIEYINVKTIPENPPHTIWYYRLESLKINQEKVKVEMAIAKNKEGEWLFTPKTLESLDFYEIHLKNKDVVANVAKDKSWTRKIKNNLPDWAFKKNFILLNIQWLGLFIVILLSY